MAKLANGEPPRGVQRLERVELLHALELAQIAASDVELKQAVHLTKRTRYLGR